MMNFDTIVWIALGVLLIMLAIVYILRRSPIFQRKMYDKFILGKLLHGVTDKEKRELIKQKWIESGKEISRVESFYGSRYDINDPAVLFKLINDPKVPKVDKSVLSSVYKELKKGGKYE